uniref:Ral guanine nucleotide dissociation stimulator-like 3a n=1 Tax=Tetraodon nigroviridis TaxID=99883 RepID=H3D3D8_TETNG
WRPYWMNLQDPVQEWGEEEEDGAVFGITLRREAALPGSDPAELSTACIQYHTVKVRRLKAATLERLVTHLLDPEQQEPDFAHVFFATYRAFTTTSTLIELLFQSVRHVGCSTGLCLRDESTVSLDNAICLPSTLLPVIRLWLEEHSEDFQDPPQYQGLRLLCAHLRRRLCFRRLVQTAESLLKRLQDGDCSQSASEVGHQELSRQEERGETKEEARLGLVDFPARDVAEQLTRLDAELFVKVVPFHCLGCIWSQRDKKENRNLAPSVRATICQFNAVTNRVITSLLCPLAPGPAHRARIMERWISIAQECRQLKNFSSLRAILSALQSNAVYRLKKTWAAVSRESMATFDQLCQTFPDENCVLSSREILEEFTGVFSASCRTGVSRTAPARLSSAQQPDRRQSVCGGVVPYLGTYLTVLTMLDTALADTVEGGLINFEKHRREFEILSQIRQLQASCSQYSLPVNRGVTSWVQAPTLLTDQESYELSRELEPPVDPCPSSPNSWSSRILNKKILLLDLKAADGVCVCRMRTVSESSLRRTHADQISVSSSGSSNADMEDLSTPQPLKLNFRVSRTPRRVFQRCPSPPGLSPLLSTVSLPDLCSSLLLTPKPSEQPASSCSPPASLPVYNKQVDDSCIIRVSVESVSNCSVYKSILLTSQDHTPQVIRRALEKHHMEDFRCQDFSLCQTLKCGKELQIPDKANVFYAMCTSSNYDFVLRQR